MDEIRKEMPKASGFVYGTGDSELLNRARNAKRVTVKGYYRKGSLPSLLARDRIGVAVLPAIWPDAYSLVVDDCLSAGVPVVAFELGAVADRLGYWEVGKVVPLTEGVGGLAYAAADLLDSQTTVPSSIVKTLPPVDRAAKRHMELYRFIKARARQG